MVAVIDELQHRSYSLLSLLYFVGPLVTSGLSQAVSEFTISVLWFKKMFILAILGMVL